MPLKAGVRWLLNAAKRDESTAKATLGAYQTVFDPQRPEGRRVLEDLAKYCNVESTSFVPNNPHQTSFNEGQRDVFQHVCGMLGLHPVDFVIPNSREGE